MAGLNFQVERKDDVSGGAEAAVHTARLYARDLLSSEMLSTDKMLLAVKNHAPDLFAFVHSTYSM